MTDQSHPLILGTAGHIDHGKTVLIKALTGIDTDRLKEEKARGISIDLGFAHLELPSGQRLGIVDVPGHERFVKNMLAGATGIDMVLLVVAADDGLMPQTLEHLAIIDLLGISRGVVAITKCDLAEDDWIDMVEEDIRGVLKGTALEGAPIVRVSAREGRGLDDLKRELDVIAMATVRREDKAPARLPVDRVFSLTGAGTVVTGTLWSGHIRPEDKVVLQPEGREARVRSVQVHGEKSTEAEAGQRVALNLAGLAKTDLARGDWATAPRYLSPSWMVDVRLRLLAGAPRPLRHRTRVRLHHGTSEILGRVVLLDQDELAPGNAAFAQLKLEAPIVPKRGDRFIIRSYSPVQTIGGGRIVDSHPRRHRRHDAEVVKRLDELTHADPDRVVAVVIEEEAWPVALDELVARTELETIEVEEAVNRLLSEDKVAVLDFDGKKHYVAPGQLDYLEERLLRYLGEYHLANPLKKGADKQVMRAEVFGDAPARTFEGLLGYFASRGLIKMTGPLVAHAEAKLDLGERDEKALERVEQELGRELFAPPELTALIEAVGRTPAEVKEMLKILEEKGSVTRVTSDLYFLTEAVDHAVQTIEGKLAGENGFTVSDFRQAVGTSRKYALPLLNFFDARGLTRRDGDVRRPR